MKRLGMFVGVVMLLGVLALVVTDQVQTQKATSLPSPNIGRIPKEVNGIPSIWHIYRSDMNGFIIRHPVDVTAETTTEGDRFYKLGDTQSMGTELYDGISVVISKGRMQGKNFTEFVKSQYDTTKKEATTQSITPIKTISVANKQGFAFHLSSLGERDVIYLPKGHNEYLRIINGTVEPQNQKRDFREVVEKMLNSIEYTEEEIQPIIEQ